VENETVRRADPLTQTYSYVTMYTGSNERSVSDCFIHGSFTSILQ